MTPEVIPLEHLEPFCPVGHEAELIRQWFEVSTGGRPMFNRIPASFQIKTLAEVEREHIAMALRCTHSIKAAARALGVNPVTLYRKKKRALA